MSHVTLDNVSLVYQRSSAAAALRALQAVTLDVERGQFVAIVGPSGCGKSSLLLLANGLLLPTSGRVLINGEPVRAPSSDRALVFQEFGPRPWRTVLQKVELGLELRRRPSQERRDIARRNLRLVGLSAFEGYFPHQLSGGMR